MDSSALYTDCQINISDTGLFVCSDGNQLFLNKKKEI